MSYNMSIHGLDSNGEPVKDNRDIAALDQELSDAAELKAQERDALQRDWAGHTPGKDQSSDTPGIFKGGQYPQDTAVSVFKYPTVFERLPEIAVQIAQELDQAGFPEDQMLTRQMLSIGEEVGEFQGAVRRFYGMARRTGTWSEVLSEWADCLITLFVTSTALGITRPQLEIAVEEKLAQIFTRGWHENDPAQESLNFDQQDDRIRVAAEQADIDDQ